jgi:hypothetical protein
MCTLDYRLLICEDEAGRIAIAVSRRHRNPPRLFREDASEHIYSQAFPSSSSKTLIQSQLSHRPWPVMLVIVLQTVVQAQVQVVLLLAETQAVVQAQGQVAL